jgi:hypothetical protein
MVKDNLGCSDYGGLTKMFARVQLSGPWHLGTFKSDLPDQEEREELEKAVEIVLEPILQQCNAASMDARIDSLGEKINEGLPTELVAARPHRRKKDENEPSRPKRPKRNHKGIVDSDKCDIDKGPSQTRAPQQGRLMILLEGKNEEEGIGLYKSGRPDRVYLSIDNPVLGKLAQYRDQEFAADALRTIALAIYVQGRKETGNAEHQLEFSYKPFGLTVAELLALNTEKAPTISSAPLSG